jgi:hypothetical protein
MNNVLDNPNYLNILNIRKLNFIPKHFTTIKIINESYWGNSILTSLDKWIYNNLNGRYAIVEDLDILENKTVKVCKIGFEIRSESSYFTLGCSDLAGQDVKVL